MIAPRLERRLRGAVPALTVLLAALLDGLPLLGAGPHAFDPALTWCVVYFWLLRRPDRLGAPALFLAGLAHDATRGLPLGATALLLLLLRHGWPARPPAPGSWLREGLGLALFVTAAEALLWLAACLWWGAGLPLRPLALTLPATLIAYPPLAWLLGGLRRHLPAAGHAL